MPVGGNDQEGAKRKRLGEETESTQRLGAWMEQKGVDRRHPCIIVVDGPSAGQVFRLAGRRTLIGRGQDVHVRIQDSSVSREHAEVLWDSERYVLRDLRSTNGTFVEDQRVDERELQPGQRFRLGVVVLRFDHLAENERHMHEKLLNDALRDPLTGLFNRKALMDRMRREIEAAARNGTCTSVVLSDIDHFKKINDAWGHPVGDTVVHAVGERLMAVAGAEHLVARYGGEEYVVVLPRTNEHGALNFAERVRLAVCGKPFAVSRPSEGLVRRGLLEVTVSLGTCTFAGPDDRLPEPEALIEAADRALYEAKHGGRNCTRSSRWAS